MKRLEQIQTLIKILLTEMPEIEPQAAIVPKDLDSQRHLLRALMNIRPPMPLKSSFLTIQDQLLQAETKEKGIINLDEIDGKSQIRTWQGDITIL